MRRWLIAALRFARPRSFAWALAVVPAPAAAQAPAFHYPLPAPSRMNVRRAIPYTRVDERDVVMDFYRPAGSLSGAARPLIIFLNAFSERSQRGEPMVVGWASAATAHGLAAIASDASPDLAAGFDALLAYLRQHSGELGIDPERIALHAGSGNVSRALPLVEDPERLGVKAAVMYYGAADSIVWRPDLPVLLVRAGLDRPGANESIDEMAASALLANAPIQVLNHPGGHHAFEIVDDTDATRQVIERTFEWVKSALEPRYQASLRAGIPEARAAGAALSGDFATAAALFRDLVTARPADPRLRLSYAEALLGTKRYAEALAEFDRLKGAPLGARDLGLPAARAAAAAGDAAAAIAWLRTIPRRFLPRDAADHPEFRTLRGRADFEELFR